jgi:hypothetical protein
MASIFALIGGRGFDFLSNLIKKQVPDALEVLGVLSQLMKLIIVLVWWSFKHHR